MRQGAGKSKLEWIDVRVAWPRRVLMRLARDTRKALLPGGLHFRRIPFGITRSLRIENDLHQYVYLWLGLYEYETQRHLRRLAIVGAHAYDIGAASGVASLALAKLTKRTVVAFEADPEALVGLTAHLAANPRYRGLIEVERRFVGRATDSTTVRLDDYVVGREPPTLLKIDVEGAELDVLLGALQLLRQHRPHLLVETHSYRLEQDCGDLLLEIGYRPLIIPRRRRLKEDRPAVHNRWLVAEGAAPVRT
jgi:predicted RNA methylase